MKQEHIKQIEAAVAGLKGKKITHFYFVACGGSKALLHPVQYIMDLETEIPASVVPSNEFVHRAPKALGPGAVVITCSHSGNTPETVKATSFAREKGAATIALSNLVDSPLWEAAEFPIHYEWGDTADASDCRYSILYALTFGILNLLAPCQKYQKAIACLDQIQKVIERNVESHLSSADEFGKNYKREPIIYTMGSGACFGCAYSFAICLLQEMQWIHSSAIHAGEYFHGPFEITDYDVPFLIIKGMDECRPLDDRAHTFCQKYSNKITVVDAQEFDMNEIDADLRGYFAPIVVDSVLRKYADAIADHRGHPLSVRRYMWRMEY